MTNKKIASLGLLLVPFAVGRQAPFRSMPRGNVEDSNTAASRVDARWLKMMMMGSRKHHYSEPDDFVHDPDYEPPEYYSKGKGGGMMMMNKSGMSRGKGSSYYDDYHPSDDYPTDDYHPPVATFEQTLGCYYDVSDYGIPCIYSHNADATESYELNMECRWQVTDDAVVFVEYFDLETGFDFLTVANVSYTSTGEGLDGAPVMAGDEFIFESDMMNPTPGPAGFKVCLANPPVYHHPW